MIYEKRTSLLLFKMRKDILKHGKTNIFETYTDTYTYSLSLLSIAKHHSSWFSSFICDNNENVFMKKNQRVSSYWYPRRFSKVPNRKSYDLVSMSRHYFKHVCSFTKGKKYIKLMLDILFSKRHHSNTMYRE
jgi:hypothetical protein